MNPPFRLALVTGASSGIGESFCRILAENGVHLILTGRNELALFELANELRSKVNVVVYPSDLSTKEGRAVIVRKIRDLTPDLIVNNAGLGYYGSVVRLETENQMEVLNVNVHALTELSVEASKALVESKTPGVILNISSAAGFFPFPNFAVYAATKAYVNSFSQALDGELKEAGIRVLSACPGMVETNFSLRASKGKRKDRFGNKMTSEYAARVIWKNLLKRKRIFVFNWPYRIANFFVNHLIPTGITLKFLKKIFSR